MHEKKLGTVEFLLINVPVLLFCLCAGGGLAAILSSAGTRRIPGILFTWWSLSGAVMLSLDYPNRVKTFQRLLRISRREDGLKKVKHIFSDTLCGWCISLAVSRRLHARVS